MKSSKSWGWHETPSKPRLALLVHAALCLAPEGSPMSTTAENIVRLARLLRNQPKELGILARLAKRLQNAKKRTTPKRKSDFT